jgi:hypothetical protein
MRVVIVYKTRAKQTFKTIAKFCVNFQKQLGCSHNPLVLNSNCCKPPNTNYKRLTPNLHYQSSSSCCPKICSRTYSAADRPLYRRHCSLAAYGATTVSLIFFIQWCSTLSTVNSAGVSCGRKLPILWSLLTQSRQQTNSPSR